METADISEALDLRKKQFVQYCCSGSFHPFHAGGEAAAEKYVKKQISSGNAIAAVENNASAGYMAWMTFDFRNERTAFLPAGHAAVLRDEISICSAMSRHALQNRVNDNRLNHLRMIYYDDEKVKNELYELGFGSYIADSYQSTSLSIGNPSFSNKIEPAALKDTDDLLEIAEYYAQYFIESAIFLKRRILKKQDIENILEECIVLTAGEGDKIIVVMSFSADEDFDSEHLTTAGSAYIGNPGAFVYPQYSGKGAGSALLENTFRICRENGKSHIHVSFESSNPYASGFWPRYFKPAVRSVRRTINKDADDAV